MTPGDSLAEALALLAGPEANEDWSAWRVRSLMFVERFRSPADVGPTVGLVEAAIKTAVDEAKSVPCDHDDAVPVCSGCAERMARLLVIRLLPAASGKEGR